MSLKFGRLFVLSPLVFLSLAYIEMYGRFSFQRLKVVEQSLVPFLGQLQFRYLY
jgi:hypothetical protein